MAIFVEFDHYKCVVQALLSPVLINLKNHIYLTRY